MRRGTTPQINITLDFEISLIETAIITFKQKNEVVLEKEMTDCQCSQNVMSVTLTQEETLQFTTDAPLTMQAKFKLTAGDVVATDIYKFNVEEIYNEEVI